MDLDIIDLEPSDTEELTPSQFLRLYEDEKDDIASVRIVPPVPGSMRGFGRIVVKRKTPTYAYRGAIGKLKRRAKMLKAKAKTAA
jgi:hypothetical protein